MSAEPPLPVVPDFERETVVQLARAAFYRSAEYDYANGYIIQEEDVRASVYRYIRDALDLAPAWRVFLNLTTSDADETEAGLYKPDLIFFHSPDNHATATVEMLVEIKHWPSPSRVERDIDKLLKLRQSFTSAPAIAFFAIVGRDFRDRDAIEIEQEYVARYPGVSVWFRHHDALYRGPWDHVTRLNPWQRAMRRL